jgi:hypothetical protein
VTSRETSRCLIAALSAAALAGCAASSDGPARFLVAPDQYIFYNCLQLADASRANTTRQRELEKLIAKASTDSTGRFVSNMAYQPEYVQLRGLMTELRKEAVRKNCRFTPGVDVPGGLTSEEAVR